MPPLKVIAAEAASVRKVMIAAMVVVGGAWVLEELELRLEVGGWRLEAWRLCG